MSARVTTAPNRVVAKAVGADYEFWKSDAERTLKAVAIWLLAKGFDEEDAAEIIGSVFSAGAEEYGA